MFYTKLTLGALAAAGLRTQEHDVLRHEANVVEEWSSGGLVTRDEFRRLFPPGQTQAAAEKSFNLELSRSSSSLAETKSSVRSGKHKSKDNVNATIGASAVDFRKTLQYEDLRKQTESVEKQLEKRAGIADEEKLREIGLKFLDTLKPKAHVQVCTYVKYVFFDGFGQISVTLGISGNLGRDWKNGCWYTSIDIDAGFLLGFKVFDMGGWASMGVHGTLSMAEMPPKVLVNQDKANNAEKKDQMLYVPRGLDLGKCHSKSPWPMLTTWVKTQIKEARKSKSYQAQYESLLAKDLVNKQRAREEYGWLLEVGEEGDHAGVLPSPRQLWNGVALEHRRSDFFNMVLGLATISLARIVDDGKPDSKYEMLESFENNDGSKRNLAKAARLSQHNGEALFWKRLSLSAADFMMQFLENVRASFALAFGGAPDWDGNCGSLGVTVDVANFKSEAKHHSWAGVKRSMRTDFLPDFSREQQVFHPQLWCRAAERAWSEQGYVSPAVQDLVNSENAFDATVFQACNNVEFQYETFDAREHRVYWSDEKQRVLVRAGDEEIGFLWAVRGDAMGIVDQVSITEEVGGPNVQRMRSTLPGSDFIDGPYLHVQADELFVARNVMSTRTECQQVRFSAPFMAVFPIFMSEVERIISTMELLLLEINQCLGQTPTVEAMLGAVPDKMKESVSEIMGRAGCAWGDGSDATDRFVQKRGRQMLSFVAEQLRKFGGEVPEKFDPEVNAHFGVQSEPATVDNSSFADVLWDDLTDSLGVGSVAVEEGAEFIAGERVEVRHGLHARHATVVRQDGDDGVEVVEDGRLKERTVEAKRVQKEGKKLVFVGRLWQLLTAVRVAWSAQKFTLPLMKRKDLLLRPPVTFSQSVTLYAKLTHNDICRLAVGIMEFGSVASKTFNSWTDDVKTTLCMTARARPGHFFVDIFRCQADGVEEWRLKYSAMLFALTTGGHMGLGVELANIAWDTALTNLGAIGSGVVAGAVLSPLLTKIEDHEKKMFGADAGLMGAFAAPLAGAFATAAYFQEHTQGFYNVMRKAKAFTNDPRAFGAARWRAASVFVISGTVSYKIKDVPTKDLTAREYDLLKEQVVGGKVKKVSRTFALNVMNCNRLLAPTTEIPGLGPMVTATGSFGLIFNWDFTPWLESMNNYRKLKAVRGRRTKCSKCLRGQMAWCDTKHVLGSLWKKKNDDCIPDDDIHREECESVSGFVDHAGQILRGQFYSSKSNDHLSCGRIPIKLSNSENWKPHMN